MAETNFADLIEKIEKLSVLELSQLVKELEEKFGVSAATPMMMAGPAAGAAAAEEVVEKTSFKVVLTAAGDQKINVIKAVREVLPALGLKEAKDVVDGAPKELGDMKKEDAEAAKAKLEAVGASVELR
jgi:large subunit ribosomal protein L7/L12